VALIPECCCLKAVAFAFVGRSVQPVKAFECDGVDCNGPEIFDTRSAPQAGPGVSGPRRGCALRRHGGIPRYDQPELLTEAHKMKWLQDGALSDVPRMPMNLRRHIIYYFVSTNIYCVGGRYKRLVVPMCYKTCIRATYPNKRGFAYSDFHTDP
jgi:hypothetical protein